MKKALILLHGFKRNGLDDFEEMDLKSFSNEYDIFNVEWFENYNKQSLNSKSVFNKIDEISFIINNGDYESVNIIGYSAGSIVAIELYKRIKINKKMITISPPITIHLFKWVKLIFSTPSKSRKLKKKLGKERYAKLKTRVSEGQIAEKYPIKIALLINNFRLRYRSDFKYVNPDDLLVIMSPEDHIVKTNSSIKYLKRKGINNIVNIDYNHEHILRSEKEKIISVIENEWK